MFEFGLGTAELLFIAVVAVLVVDPKDMPKLFRALGQFMSRVRAMAREFQGHIEEAARETGFDDLKKDVKKVTDFSSAAVFKGNELEEAVSDISKSIDQADRSGDDAATSTPSGDHDDALPTSSPSPETMADAGPAQEVSKDRPA